MSKLFKSKKWFTYTWKDGSKKCVNFKKKYWLLSLEFFAKILLGKPGLSISVIYLTSQ